MGSPLKIVTHSKRVLDVAGRLGWLPGARYTNLRDIRHEPIVGMIDICWRTYNFEAHLRAVRTTRPVLTVARDVLHRRELDGVLSEADLLAKYCGTVVIVPKDRRLRHSLDAVIPTQFRLGYSVPTRYGTTPIEPRFFRRPVHLLGGRPDTQRHLANELEVASLDCNRFTLDAAFGDYFDGQTFRPHPTGGYERCLEDSLLKINELWAK